MSGFRWLAVCLGNRRWKRRRKKGRAFFLGRDPLSAEAERAPEDGASFISRGHEDDWLSGVERLRHVARGLESLAKYEHLGGLVDEAGQVSARAQREKRSKQARQVAGRRSQVGA